MNSIYNIYWLTWKLWFTFLVLHSAKHRFDKSISSNTSRWNKKNKKKNEDKLSKLEDRVEGKYSYNICFPKWMFTEIMLQFIFYVCMRMGGFVLGRCVCFLLDIKMVFMVLFFPYGALTFFLWEKKNNKKFGICDYISNQMTNTF